MFAIRIDAPINPDGEGCHQYLTWPEIWTGGIMLDENYMPKGNKNLTIEAATFTSYTAAENAWEDYEYRAVRDNREPLPCVIEEV
jgi:hypothetical protein